MSETNEREEQSRQYPDYILPADEFIDSVVSAPNLLILHGHGNPKEAYLPLAAELGDCCRPILVDLPGYGAQKDRHFSFETAVDTVETVLDTEGSAYLFGHSLGGYVAVETAGKRPHSIEGIINTGATLNYARLPGYRYCIQSILTDYTFEAAGLFGFEPYEWATKQLLDGIDVDVLDGELIEMVDVPTFTAETNRQVQNSLWGHNSFTPLLNYDGEILLLNGAEDNFHCHVDEFTTLAPQTEIQTIDGAGHNAVHTHTGELADSIRSTVE